MVAALASSGGQTLSPGTETVSHRWIGGFRHHNYGDDCGIVAWLVEVLEVQSIVPYLVSCGPKESHRTDLELQDENHRPQEQNKVGPPPHSGNGELEVDLTIPPSKRGLEKREILRCQEELIGFPLERIRRRSTSR